MDEVERMEHHDPERGCKGCSHEIMDSATDVFCAAGAGSLTVGGEWAPASCPLRSTEVSNGR